MQCNKITIAILPATKPYKHTHIGYNSVCVCMAVWRYIARDASATLIAAFDCEQL